MARVFCIFIFVAVYFKISRAQIPTSFFRQHMPYNGQSIVNTIPNTLPINLSPISKLKSIPESLGINLPTNSQKVSTPPSTSNLPNAISSNIGPTGLDSTVLNNLAIALQLLIVSNILSSPNSDAGSELPDDLSTVLMTPSFNLPSRGNVVESIPVRIPKPGHNNPISSMPVQSSPVSSPYHKQVSYPSIPESYTTPYQQNPHHNMMPMANFVGSSGFVDSGSLINNGHRSGHMHPRSSLSLMSPYEAIGPNSPFTDPILSSPYGSAIISKKDFQSPYSFVTGDSSDAFPMNDLF